MKTCPTTYLFKNFKDLIINSQFYHLFKRHHLSSYQELRGFDEGDVFRKNSQRSVARFVLFDENNHENIFHIKKYKLNFKDIVKQLFIKNKTEDLKNEWDKIIELHKHDLKTMTPVLYSEKKINFLKTHTILVTEHLYGTKRLEEYLNTDFNSIDDKKKMKSMIIGRLAQYSSKFHQLGFRHNDFYLGHFFVDLKSFDLYLIDLQRVWRSNQISERALVKDLAQLYFSTFDVSIISKKDCLSFFKKYMETEKLEKKHKHLIKKIILKAQRIQKHTLKVLGKRKSS